MRESPAPLNIPTTSPASNHPLGDTGGQNGAHVLGCQDLMDALFAVALNFEESHDLLNSNILFDLNLTFCPADSNHDNDCSIWIIHGTSVDTYGLSMKNP